MKTFYTFLSTALFLLLTGCASKNVLNQMGVVTQGVVHQQEVVWNQTEAKKQIPIKKLRVLVMDCTDTHNLLGNLPQQIEVFSPDAIRLDTVFRNVNINFWALESFKNSVPSKASVVTMIPQASEAHLKAFIQSGKYDLVIAARQMDLHYTYDYEGWEAYAARKKPSGQGSGSQLFTRLHNDPLLHNYIGPGEDGIPVFSVDFNREKTHSLSMHTLQFQAKWDFYWTKPASHPSAAEVTQITQKGAFTSNSNFSIEMLEYGSQLIGKSLAQLLAW